MCVAYYQTNRLENTRKWTGKSNFLLIFVNTVTHNTLFPRHNIKLVSARRFSHPDIFRDMTKNILNSTVYSFFEISIGHYVFTQRSAADISPQIILNGKSEGQRGLVEGVVPVLFKLNSYTSNTVPQCVGEDKKT